MKQKSQRNTNLEILRIISMFLIISHHFAVHGMKGLEFIASNPNTYVVYFFGILVKIGVVVFILISAYFMINSTFTFRKLLVLGGEVYFYSLLFLGLVVQLTYLSDPLTIADWGVHLLPISHSAYWFVTGYIVLMVLSPFLNKFLKSLSKETYIKLIVVVMVMWSIFPTFTPIFMIGPIANNFIGSSFQYVPLIWFVVIYIIGSFIRLHVDLDKISYKTLIATFSVGMIITYAISCIVGYLDIVHTQSSSLHMIFGLPLEAVYYDTLYLWPALENKLFLFVASVALFLIFLKREEFSNKYLNYIAGSALGVYLIHDNLLIRAYIWQNILGPISYYNSPYLFFIAIAMLIVVYVVCTGLDIIRRETIEKVWIWIVDNKLIGVSNWFERKYKSFENYLGNYLK
ncbi:acyltransferase [uncultured Methanobrevibacter sp.]|uniref:acyltransferase family protein n=1 Tax=uncultured Methanobrevibacter sp. TaxID=253161 RepID=UPI0025D18679|nr:acyltransferase [uncultured Methanobrevibacter sp.]